MIGVRSKTLKAKQLMILTYLSTRKNNRTKKIFYSSMKVDDGDNDGDDN